MRIGFVNNMPDAAFQATERQFLALLGNEAGGAPLEVERYALAQVPRSAAMRRQLARSYRPVGELVADPPDGLVVTGTEPRAERLRDEPYWPALSDLLAWATGTVPAVMCSCLASHAVLEALHGIERRRLRKKLSGVYGQVVRRGTHPVTDRLTAGLGEVVLPHSRLNDVPARAIAGAGYTVVLEGPDCGWSAAVGERDGRLLLLLQGHPEYSRTTLLREYRRDVRRYLAGSLPAHPALPEGYLDAAGQRLLEAFRAECERDPSRAVDAFPFDEAASHVAADWLDASTRLVRNWLGEAASRRPPAGAVAVSNPRSNAHA